MKVRKQTKTGEFLKYSGKKKKRRLKVEGRNKYDFMSGDLYSFFVYFYLIID